MKKLISVMILFFVFSFNISGQWTNEWVSPVINSTNYSGWLNFQRSGNEWLNKYYVINETTLSIMNSEYSSSILYSYTFSSPELLGGRQVYSLQADLTGDNITEFYILGYYGITEPYRQSMKIFDITNGSILFERNDESYCYSYPVIWDVDNDGLLECTFARYDYPNFIGYIYESYNTKIAVGITSNVPLRKEFILGQNYPNPFNPSTKINFSLDTFQKVAIRIFDSKGELVKTLLNNSMDVGDHFVEWDGTDHSGRRVASGAYFYQVNAGSTAQTKKMILLK